MIISNQSSIYEVQQAFQQKFPYLKLEFYDTEHAIGEGSAPNRPYRDSSQTIGNIRSKSGTESFTIKEQVSVATLERTFFRQYGLNIRVFRKAGHCWLETAATDHWTLEQQNTKGQGYVKRGALA
ncbi:MAG: hypothetical protein AAGI23_02710 [Bacteroidota bacterium]